MSATRIDVPRSEATRRDATMARWLDARPSTSERVTTSAPTSATRDRRTRSATPSTSKSPPIGLTPFRASTPSYAPPRECMKVS